MHIIHKKDKQESLLTRNRIPSHSSYFIDKGKQNIKPIHFWQIH